MTTQSDLAEREAACKSLDDFLNLAKEAAHASADANYTKKTFAEGGNAMPDAVGLHQDRRHLGFGAERRGVCQGPL